LLLDLDRFEANLQTLAASCRAAQIDFRPHTKTHKSSTIAKLQIASGATGVCVATLREAAVMVAAGVPGVLLTSPIVGSAKIEAFVQLLGRGVDPMVVIDNATNLRAIGRQLRHAGRRLRVLVDIDLGMRRTGLADPDGVVALIKRIGASKEFSWEGIQAYSGMVQHIVRYGERKRVYGEQLTRLARLLERLGEEGLQPRVVSGGGTGTFELDRTAGLFTEVQCGSYAFMDVEYQAVRLRERQPNPYQSALLVQCSVVSNNAAGFATLDGGSKSFATDGPLPRVVGAGHAGVRYEFYGDEFGRLKLPGGREKLKLGSKVELLAPHCDPTVNLHDRYHCVRGGRLEAIWPIDARGSL
jgi:D-serine deaminase-like pyridoxal phosphate-dependent protein